MSREQKLALIVGFSLILLVGVLISDHLSRARQSKVEPVTKGEAAVLTDVGLTHPPEPLSDHPQELAVGNGQTPAGPVSSAIENLGHAIVGIANGQHSAAAQTEAVPGNAPGPDVNNGLSTGPAGPSTIHPTVGSTPAGQNPASPDLDRMIAEGGTIQPGPGRDIFYTPPRNVDPAPPGPSVSPVPNPGRKPDTAAPAPKIDDATVRWHTVTKGDTLTSISKQYYGTPKMVAKLQEINPDRIGAGGVIRIGARLRVPAKEVLTGEPTPPARDPQKPRPQATAPGRLAEGPAKKPEPEVKPSAKPKAAPAPTYTVKAGDTLGDIAKKALGSSRRAGEIASLNESVIDDEDALVVGTVLKLPTRVASR